MDYVHRAVWGILYADDACMVSQSPQGLAKMMEVLVEVCQAFALTVSAKKTETMYVYAPTAYTADDDANRGSRVNLQRGETLHLPWGHRDRNPGYVR